MEYLSSLVEEEDNKSRHALEAGHFPDPLDYGWVGRCHAGRGSREEQRAQSQARTDHLFSRLGRPGSCLEAKESHGDPAVGFSSWPPHGRCAAPPLSCRSYIQVTQAAMMLADQDHDGGLNRDEFYDFLNPEGEGAGRRVSAGMFPRHGHSAPPQPNAPALDSIAAPPPLQRAATST